ncbi:2-polyprenyl-6-methoxyphenol hydroxylase-like FAD-dependent oxidoreductase [Actinoplanes tereljensis]|uniref:FAD-dependent oxidoreductase n=1 Tax=Paractinoplanes tereljensis TaxID=571912 RepID=A0A919NXH6_9ACTN|nr:FAD-dependent monooxygenase [Actinoplanes tereljensis]GIF26558.1 FAD-dependent oxidoreductase [Actinoplanes tereljensis]
MPPSALRTPVLVAGAGVVGSLTALELAHHGVPSMVVERADRPARIPDLLLINGRSMELLRRLDLTRDLRAAGLDPDCPLDFLWSAGIDRPPALQWRLPPVATLRQAYASTTDGTAPIEPYLLISSPGLIGRLRRALRGHPLIDLRTRWTLTEVEAEADTVTATVLDAEAGARHFVEAGYLAGCDGADSTVRRCAGLTLEELGPPAPHLILHFRSPTLAARWANPTVAVTGGTTVITGHDGDRCVAYVPLTADEQAALANPADLLQDRLGVAEDPSRIVTVVQRAGVPSVARSYRRGRVFLAGQAAHQVETPGDDLATCIGDAVGLGWRLAAAVHGWAGDRLLAGYQTERRRQALADREHAVRRRATRLRLQRLVESGVDGAALAAVLRNGPAQLDPAGTGPAELAGVAGYRPPAFRLTGGGQFFDRLGPQFTLVDLTVGQDGYPLVKAARTRGIPVRHLPLAGAPTPAAWSGRLVLIRPDQVVVWSADGPPIDCDGVLDEATGARSRLYENT